jgi:hypothetical protein
MGLNQYYKLIHDHIHMYICMSAENQNRYVIQRTKTDMYIFINLRNQTNITE